MRVRGRALPVLAVAFLTICCGGIAVDAAQSGHDRPLGISDSGEMDASLPSVDARSGDVTTACVPGESVACTGPGGCASNQVCKSDGRGFGACTCAPGPDASTRVCVPGQSITCAGPGGCISNQVCNVEGDGYGPCTCASGEESALTCIAGKSIACVGPYGCASHQVCNGAGTAYGPCDCHDAGSSIIDAGTLPDGYAPLPPPVGQQGYNAIWSASRKILFLPLFSAPSCAAIYPYGEYYSVAFTPPAAGPGGTFPACFLYAPGGPDRCYTPARWNGALGGAGNNPQAVPGGVYTLSDFDEDGLARGQMNTNEGIVPLVVLSCP